MATDGRIMTVRRLKAATARITKGGDLRQPYVVSESRRFGQFVERVGSPKIVNHIVISKRTQALVRTAMIDVVKNGTGISAQVAGTDVAGKTGTAQVTKGKEHAW